MESVYETVSTVGFIVAILCACIAVFLWFYFDIRAEFQVISGRGERQARREPREFERKQVEVSSFGVRVTERMGKTSDRLDQSSGTATDSAVEWEGTEVLAEDGIPSGLEQTTVLEETPVVVGNRAIDDHEFILLEEISWMQAQERIAEEEE